MRIEGGAIKSTIKESKEVIPLKIDPEFKEIMNEAKKILHQAKPSTLIKQLARIGYKSIKSPPTSTILKTIYENDRKNKRVGIVEFEV